jgi:hypothetical protein
MTLINFYRLRKENLIVRKSLDEYKDNFYENEEKFVIIEAKIGKA